MRESKDPAVESLIAAVKGWDSPASLRVYLMEGGEPVTVAISNKRNKYVSVRQTMATLDWVRVEGINRRGEMVNVYEHPEVDSIENLDGHNQNAVLAGQLNLMLRAQDVALKRHGDFHTQMMESLVKIVSDLSDRLVQYGERNSELQEAIGTLIRNAAGGEDSDEMMKMAMPLMLRMMGGTGTPAVPPKAPPNGGG